MNTGILLNRVLKIRGWTGYGPGNARLKGKRDEEKFTQLSALVVSGSDSVLTLVLFRPDKGGPEHSTFMIAIKG
jgi:hypothetical protein